MKGTLQLALHGVPNATAQAATSQGLSFHEMGPSKRLSGHFTSKLFTQKFAMFHTNTWIGGVSELVKMAFQEPAGRDGQLPLHSRDTFRTIADLQF